MTEYMSSFCNRGECVVVSATPERVLLRSTRTPGFVVFTHDEWVAHVQGVKNGEFDLEKLLSP